MGLWGLMAREVSGEERVASPEAGAGSEAWAWERVSGDGVWIVGAVAGSGACRSNWEEEVENEA